ncbi:hypothetical protein HD554DRAFT_2036319 [Boletus coccyginus]|nr:hypothetical protein HD554DRAFT_2036319 [Boletus coccyginus]
MVRWTPWASSINGIRHPSNLVLSSTFPVGFPTDKKGKKFVLVKLIAPVHSSSSRRCSGLGLSRGGGGTRQCLVTSPTTDRVKGKVGLDRRGGNSNGRTHGALAQSRVFLGQGSTISDYSDATTHDRYHPNNDPAGFGSVPVVRHAHTHAHGLEGCSGLGMRGMALESRPDRKRGEFAFSVYDMHGCFCAAVLFVASMTKMSVLQVLDSPSIVLFLHAHGQYTRRDDDPRKMFGELQDQDRPANACLCRVFSFGPQQNVGGWSHVGNTRPNFQHASGSSGCRPSLPDYLVMINLA